MKLDLHVHLIAAQRVPQARARRRRLERTLVSGPPVMVEDDFQLASLLVAVARSATVTASTRELYGTAARTLQNQWEYRRAMNALTQ